MKPSDVDIVSFEISHASLAMIKLKSNVISFFFTCHVAFCFTLQAVLRINVLHEIVLLVGLISYKNRSC